MEHLTKESLFRLYTKELKTETEIASMFGISQSKVGRLRKKWEIPTLIKSDRLQLPEIFTPRLKSILLGSMLGDGHLIYTGKHTAAYYESHSIKQKSYLEWKVLEWSPFVSRVRERSDPRGYKGINFTTHASRLLLPYHTMFYPKGAGAKEFSNVDPEEFDALALAVWFMDDGSRTENYVRFSVGPDKGSVRQQLRVLKKLGLKGTLCTENTDPCIHITGRGNLSKFVDMVAPHLLPSMTYKLDVKPRTMGPAPREVLTKETLTPLVERGLSMEEIAKILRVGRTSVCRHMKQLGIPSRGKGRRAKKDRKEYTIDEAERLLKGVRTLKETISVLSNTEIPIPKLSEDVLTHDLQLLRKAPTVVEEGTITKVSKGGSRFCSQFFPYIFDAQYRRNPSIKEAWYSPEWLEKAVKFQLRVGDPITLYRVFRALKVVVRAPTNFRPCFAKALVDAYCPENGLVLDPCAGYGGRACGVLASGRQYVGVDPHPEASPAFQSLGEAVGGSLSFHNFPFEDVDLDKLQADMVLTSPPYFSVERYSNDASQSWVRYKTWEAWLKGFLHPLVEKSRIHLVNGGIMCVNTKNIRLGGRVYPIGDELVKKATSSGFILQGELNLPIGRVGKNVKSEPIYIFKKL